MDCFRESEGRTDEDGGGPEVLDGQCLGAEGKEPGEVGRAVAVRAKGCIDKALVQHQTCSTAAQIHFTIHTIPHCGVGMEEQHKGMKHPQGFIACRPGQHAESL